MKRSPKSRLARNIFRSVLVVGVTGAFAVSGTFSALSGSTTNSNNYLSTGSVSVGDNSAGSSLYQDTGLGGGSSLQRCIQVTYTGDANADMHLFLPEGLDTLAQYTDLVVDAFEGSYSGFSDCNNLWGNSSNVYKGTLSDFQANHNSYDNGVVVYPAPWYGDYQWNQNETVVFRFSLSIQDTSVQGLSTGSHSWVWEAHNQ